MSQERAPHAHERLARLAARQHGVATLRQLYSLGYSDSQVRTRVAAGWLHPLHRAVFAVGRETVSREGWWLAAALAGGQGAVISHHSAGELWELRRRGRGNAPVHVAVAGRRGGRPRRGLVVHRLPSLAADEVTARLGIPVTTPARTILDLATFLPRRHLERVIDEADRLDLCTEEDLDAVVRLHRGQPGAGALRRLLADHEAGSTATRNALEELFLALCRKHSLPQPVVNVRLLDYV